MTDLMNELTAELKKYYGKDAEFREGQAESITSIIQGKRTLVVQKTGWGKSLVYFMAAKMLRNENKERFTLIISPLLALMDNQVDAARKLKLNVLTINSGSAQSMNLEDIVAELNNKNVDALLISPERLDNNEFKEKVLKQFAGKIGLLVVDEAHCISDWGHDFRPDYRRIVNVIESLSPNIPVLATTATANDRVVKDIQAQLGESIETSRGSLMRESLAIQTIKLNSKEERLVWLSNNIPNIPGSGVVYCLTIRDCELVNRWLQHQGIKSACYHAKLEKDIKPVIINDFMDNKIKVLVATTAFGMGFDKPDISFVIHFQKPGNVIAYYQQIGRAGRALKNAYAILLYGSEDDAINKYFIENAFPTEKLMNEVVKVTEDYPGITMSGYEKYINMNRKKIESCLKYLTVDGAIYKESTPKMYYKTADKDWKPDIEKSEKITNMRKKELAQMNDFVRISDCYMEFIARLLDDSKAKKCGKCSNCQGKDLIDYVSVSPSEIEEVSKFIRDTFDVIEPRKKWPDNKNLPKQFLCSEGRVLSNYGDAGWGRLVVEGKYEIGKFSDELVEASYERLKSFVEENDIQWLTNVSSIRHPGLVSDFAQKLASRLGLEYRDVIEKKDAPEQKTFYNSAMQYSNANESFVIKDVDIPDKNVLLVDDMVDSGWTFTVCGYKLRERGSGNVYPFALASSASVDGD